MNTKQRKVILETYGWVVTDPYTVRTASADLDRPIVVYLYDKTGQRLCSGSGSTVNAAIDNLYIMVNYRMIAEAAVVVGLTSK